jgi:hypothetical protein
VTDDRKLGRESIHRAELERHDEVEQLGPFLELAREIKREVDRIAADDSADVDALVEAVDLIPRRERQRVLLAIFDRLPPEVQWSVLERAFGDEEIREHLQSERESRLADLRRFGELRAVVGAARAAHRLDTRDIPVDEQLTLGLFREADTRAALKQGHLSATCARQVVVRCNGSGVFRVIADVFNPRGGYFVTAEYDERSWRDERLRAHAIVHVGSVSEGPSGQSFEPVLYPGGRADFEFEHTLLRGRLHLGFVILGDIDVFAD